jgi:hypothetical protein
VFNQDTQGFVGIREKFKKLYLFVEFHFDTGAPFGTVSPIKQLEALPEDIELGEHICSIDENTKRPISFNELATSWYFVDTGEFSNTIKPMWATNRKLFDWLEQREKEYDWEADND